MAQCKIAISIFDEYDGLVQDWYNSSALTYWNNNGFAIDIRSNQNMYSLQY